MKKIYTLIVLALILSFNALAQVPTFTWAKQAGAALGDRGYCITVDALGNVYTCGIISNAGPNPQSTITKRDPAGNIIWNKTFSGNYSYPFGIKVDAVGNVYTTGQLSGGVDFDPGAGTYNLAPSGPSDIYISKLDVSGNFVWAKQIGGVSTDVGQAITLDASGNVYTTGYFSSTADFDPGPGTFTIASTVGSNDIFVSKLDNSGNFVWAKNMGSSTSDYGYSIELDASNNVYTTGWFNGVADFDPGAGVFNMTANGEDAFISKLDNLGNFVWAIQFGGANNQRGYGIAIDGLNNVITTGYFGGTVDFNPGAGVFNIASVGGSFDSYVSKLDNSGNFIWAKAFGGTLYEEGHSIALDALGYIFTTGMFGSTAGDFDPGAGTFTMSSQGVQDIYIHKLDPSGNFSWAKSMGSGNADEGNSIFVNSQGNVYSTGYFTNTVDFDPNIGTYTLTSAGGDDIYVHKMADCSLAPSTPGAINGVSSLCVGAGATNYSVAPVAGAVSYTWNLPGGWSGSSSSNTIAATPGTTGIFTVTASNGCGTSPQQTLNVSVNPLPTIAVNSGSICSGSSFTMVASGANTFTYSSGPIVSPTITSSYSVTGTSTAGCVSASAAISNVTVNPLPIISANTSNTLLCVGQTATITASGASTYTFNPGGAGTNIVVSPTVTATYTINGTSAQGCNNTAVFTQSVSTCTGINQISNSVSELNIYPNPFNNKIIVIASSTEQSLQIYNALGSLVYTTTIESEKTEINLTEQPSGIYFIRIGIITKKIIKE